MRSSVLFFSHPRSEGWPHYGRTFLHLSLSSVMVRRQDPRESLQHSTRLAAFLQGFRAREATGAWENMANGGNKEKGGKYGGILRKRVEGRK